MSSKFNTDFLKSKIEPISTLSKFESTQDIFEKAKAAIEKLPIDKLVAYSKHPFKIRDNEHLAQLTDSIKEQGVLIPLIVRVHPELKGRYEILSGHHRQAAAQKSGLDEVPCVIRNVDDNMAALIVVESNKQRGFSDMLPSEVAFALKLEYEALKSQGKRTDLTTEIEEILQQKNAYKCDNGGIYSTSVPVEQKLESREKVGEKNDMSSASVRRYIRLTFLITPLLDLVDSDNIAIRPAVDLSYLNKDEQQIVLNVLNTSSYRIDMKNAEKLKEYSQLSKINEDSVKLILSGEVFKKKERKVKAVTLPIKRIQDYIPSSITPQKYDEYIIDALKYYQQKNNSES